MTGRLAPAALALFLSASARTTPARAQALPPETASYTLSVELGADHRTLRAEGTVRWVNRARVAAEHLEWHLYLNAFADARSLFARTGGALGHRGHAPGAAGSVRVTSLALADGRDLLPSAVVYGPEGDRTQLRTPLPEPLPPGGALELRIRFEGTLPAAYARTGFAQDFTFAGQWFPKLAVRTEEGSWRTFPFHANSEFFADFGSYDVTLRAPAGDLVGATGEEQPGAPAGAHRFVARGVHDFAFTAWSRFSERVEQLGPVRVRVLSPPGAARAAQRAWDTVRLALPLFEQRFGPYPYRTLTVVVAPWTAGGVEGMEYPTLLTVPDDTLLPELVHASGYVTAHELAHQWFYGLFASDENRNPVLDEGLAEYATGLALRARYGEAQALGALGAVPASFEAMQGAFSALASPGPSDRPAPDFASFDDYAAHVYRRVAASLETVARVDGAVALEQGLRAYGARARFEHPSPEGLFQSLSSVSPAAGAHLRALLTRDAALELRVRSLDRESAVLEREGSVPLAAEVRVEESGGLRRTVLFPSETPRLVLTPTAGHALEVVRLDPAQRLLLDRDRTDNARATRPPSAAALPVDARLALLLGRLLEWLGP